MSQEMDGNEQDSGRFQSLALQAVERKDGTTALLMARRGLGEKPTAEALEVLAQAFACDDWPEAAHYIYADLLSRSPGDSRLQAEVEDFQQVVEMRKSEEHPRSPSLTRAITALLFLAVSAVFTGYFWSPDIKAALVSTFMDEPEGFMATSAVCGLIGILFLTWDVNRLMRFLAYYRKTRKRQLRPGTEICPACELHIPLHWRKCPFCEGVAVSSPAKNIETMPERKIATPILTSEPANTQPPLPSITISAHTSPPLPKLNKAPVEVIEILFRQVPARVQPGLLALIKALVEKASTLRSSDLSSKLTFAEKVIDPLWEEAPAELRGLGRQLVKWDLVAEKIRSTYFGMNNGAVVVAQELTTWLERTKEQPQPLINIQETEQEEEVMVEQPKITDLVEPIESTQTPKAEAIPVEAQVLPPPIPLAAPPSALPESGPPPLPQEWYVANAEGGQEGPLTLAQVLARIQDSSATLLSLAWKQDMAEWTSLGSISEVAGALKAAGHRTGQASAQLAAHVKVAQEKAVALASNATEKAKEFMQSQAVQDAKTAVKEQATRGWAFASTATEKFKESMQRQEKIPMTTNKALLITFSLLGIGWLISAITGLYLIMWVIIIGTSIWAAFDANRIGLKKYVVGNGPTGPIVTLLGCLALWIVVFPWYLIIKGKIERGETILRTQNQTPTFSNPKHTPIAPGETLPPVTSAVTLSASNIEKSSSTDNLPKGRELPKNVAPVIITGLGIVMITISMFLPHLSSYKVSYIKNNMLIQNHPIILICGLVAIVSTTCYWQVGSKISAKVLIGIAGTFLGYIIFWGYSGEIINLTTQARVETSAGAGLWIAGVGCIIIALGGQFMLYPNGELKWLSWLTTESAKGVRPSGNIEIPLQDPITMTSEQIFPKIIACPKCSAKLRVSQPGIVQCPKCQGKIRVTDSVFQEQRISDGKSQV